MTKHQGFLKSYFPSIIHLKSFFPVAVFSIPRDKIPAVVPQVTFTSEKQVSPIPILILSVVIWELGFTKLNWPGVLNLRSPIIYQLIPVFSQRMPTWHFYFKKVKLLTASKNGLVFQTAIAYRRVGGFSIDIVYNLQLDNFFIFFSHKST